MVTLLKNYIETVRTAPLFSAFDLPWQGLEHFNLTTKCVIVPKVDSSIEAIQQTVARLFCSFLAPCITKPSIVFNLGLGGLHLTWCIFQKLLDKDIPRQEFETAFIRLATAVYDFAFMLLLCRPFPWSIMRPSTFQQNITFSAAVKIGFHLVLVPLFPEITRQIHQSIFNKIDHFHLWEGCLIKQFAKGLTDMILPPSDDTSRIFALARALGQCSTPKKIKPSTAPVEPPPVIDTSPAPQLPGTPSDGQPG